jgi:hypothetical protein
MKLLIMQSSPLPSYLVLLIPKHLVQHPVLKHPQPVFFTHGDTPSPTPIQNNEAVLRYSVDALGAKDVKGKSTCYDAQRVLVMLVAIT